MRKSKNILVIIVLATLAACNSEEAKTNKTMPETKRTGNIAEEAISYQVDGKTMKGFIYYNDSTEEKRPAVLVIPEWWGLNEYAKNRARQLADLGYFAIAVDMYGEGKQAADPKEAMNLSGPFYNEPNLGKSRIDATISKIKILAQVDTSKIAAIGYCFGGSMVLNAAKLGSELKGGVSFHGGLAGATPDKSKMKTELLICHGGADSFVPSSDSLTLRKQLDSVGAAYTFITYPNSKHAFTNPKADDYHKQFDIDVAYNAEADKKSWEDMKAFLSKIFR